MIDIDNLIQTNQLNMHENKIIVYIYIYIMEQTKRNDYKLFSKIKYVLMK